MARKKRLPKPKCIWKGSEQGTKYRLIRVWSYNGGVEPVPDLKLEELEGTDTLGVEIWRQTLVLPWCIVKELAEQLEKPVENPSGKEKPASKRKSSSRGSKRRKS